MSTKNSVLTEYKYYLTPSLKAKVIKENPFLNKLSLLTNQNSDILSITDIYQSNWSLLADGIKYIIKNHPVQSIEVSELQLLLNELYKIGPRSFIEHSTQFERFQNKPLEQLKNWSKKFDLSYSNGKFAQWDIDVVDYYLNTLNSAKLEPLTLTIASDYLIMPDGEKIIGYTIPQEDSKLLEVILYDQDDDSNFGVVVELIATILPSYREILTLITSHFGYETWIGDYLEYTKRLLKLQEYSIEHLKLIEESIKVLALDWHGSAEELLQSASKLIASK
jgi:uncharacterized HAD superfamily protein